MNYWYSAAPNEIFLDLDSNRATARALSVLRVAIRKQHLHIVDVFLYPTPTRGHCHMIIVLKNEMATWEKVAWSLWLGNDRLRCAYVLERFYKWSMMLPIPVMDFNGDLLVANRRYHRTPNAYCFCTKKHKDPKVTNKCQAMLHLLGDQRSADYFSRTGSAPPKRKIRVPWGRVALTQIRNWKAIHEQ